MKKLMRVVIVGLLLAGAWVVPQWRILFCAASYILAGYDVLLEALEGIREREVFGECFLMAIATIGAWVLGEYSEACAVMILYQLGELFGDYASDKTRDSITALMDIRPDYANVERDGRVERVDPSSVKAGTLRGGNCPDKGKIQFLLLADCLSDFEVPGGQRRMRLRHLASGLECYSPQQARLSEGLLGPNYPESGTGSMACQVCGSAGRW